MFVYKYIVSLGDTDAAGVLFFANQFKIAHLAYESFLNSIGFSVATILNEKIFALPIVHAEADFLAPVKVGDELEIRLIPLQISPYKFNVDYEIYNGRILCGKAKTLHVCIDAATGTKMQINDVFSDKLKAEIGSSVYSD